MKVFFFPLLGAGLLLSACSSNPNDATTTTTTSSSPADSSASTSAMVPNDSATKMGAAPMADSSRMAMANSNGPTAPHANDTEFMQSAAHSDQNEIQLSKMALAKGVSGPVKTFADKMIADHTKSTANLKPIAMKAGVTLPTDMDAEHQAMAPMLEKMSGKAFETKYIQQMVTDHQKTANTLQAYKPMAKAPGLEGWIITTLPVVENHLAMAKQDSKMNM